MTYLLGLVALCIRSAVGATPRHLYFSPFLTPIIDHNNSPLVTPALKLFV